MTAKVAKSFYSSANSHRDFPGSYLASYAIPGEVPQYVTVNGRVRLFTGDNAKTEAELAGFKVLVSKLNKAQDVQEFVARRSKAQQPKVYRASTPQTSAATEAEKVFRKFK